MCQWHITKKKAPDLSEALCLFYARELKSQPNSAQLLPTCRNEIILEIERIIPKIKAVRKVAMNAVYRLKILRGQPHVGSIPTTGTNKKISYLLIFFYFTWAELNQGGLGETFPHDSGSTRGGLLPREAKRVSFRPPAPI
jgi:hypothetical protein